MRGEKTLDVKARSAKAVPLFINKKMGCFRLRFPFRSPPMAALSTLGAACALRAIPKGNGYKAALE
jgi:hypothetical protein